jgi:hypothetical protein
MQAARERHSWHRSVHDAKQAIAAAASSQAAAADDARARLLAQRQPRTAATAAQLKQRAEAAHREAMTADAEADLARDVASAAEAAAVCARDERIFMLLAIDMREAAHEADQQGDTAHASVPTANASVPGNNVQEMRIVIRRDRATRRRAAAAIEGALQYKQQARNALENLRALRNAAAEAQLAAVVASKQAEQMQKQVSSQLS